MATRLGNSGTPWAALHGSFAGKQVVGTAVLVLPIAPTYVLAGGFLYTEVSAAILLPAAPSYVIAQTVSVIANPPPEAITLPVAPVYVIAQSLTVTANPPVEINPPYSATLSVRSRSPAMAISSRSPSLTVRDA